MTAGNSEQSSTDMPNCGISSHQEGISKYRRKNKGTEKAARMITLGNNSNWAENVHTQKERTERPQCTSLPI